MAGNHSCIVRTIVRCFVPFSVYIIRGLISAPVQNQSCRVCHQPPLFRNVWAWLRYDVLVLLSSVNFDKRVQFFILVPWKIVS